MVPEENRRFSDDLWTVPLINFTAITLGSVDYHLGSCIFRMVQSSGKNTVFDLFRRIQILLAIYIAFSAVVTAVVEILLYSFYVYRNTNQIKIKGI